MKVKLIVKIVHNYMENYVKTVTGFNVLIVVIIQYLIFLHKNVRHANRYLVQDVLNAIKIIVCNAKIINFLIILIKIFY